MVGGDIDAGAYRRWKGGTTTPNNCMTMTLYGRVYDALGFEYVEKIYCKMDT